MREFLRYTLTIILIGVIISLVIELTSGDDRRNDFLEDAARETHEIIDRVEEGWNSVEDDCVLSYEDSLMIYYKIKEQKEKEKPKWLNNILSTDE